MKFNPPHSASRNGSLKSFLLDMSEKKITSFENTCLSHTFAYRYSLIVCLPDTQCCPSAVKKTINYIFCSGAYSRHAKNVNDYRPRSKGDNAFGSVRLSVCVSVRALLFEPFDF